MNIDLIIEALEAHPHQYLVEGALKEARKMKGLCVWKMVGNLGFAKIYETCRGKFVLTPNIVQAVDYCFKCRRPVKYED